MSNSIATKIRILGLMVGFLAGLCPSAHASTLPPVATDMYGFGLAAPRANQVFQRNNNGTGYIRIVGLAPANTASLVVIVKNSQGAYTYDNTFAVNGNNLNLAIPQSTGGWYTIYIGALLTSGSYKWEAPMKVGIGEVFITAGQSNSVAYGQTTQPSGPNTSYVELSIPPYYAEYPNAYTWRPNVDAGPASWMPGTTYWGGEDNQGSPWAAFTTNLSERLGVPVAVTEVGCGATRITQWLPYRFVSDSIVSGQCGSTMNYKGALYDRLETAATYLDQMGGFRAILWHQGESDTINIYNAYENPSAAAYGGTAHWYDYYNTFAAIINQLNSDLGHPVSWFVAKVSYVPTNDIDSSSCALTGQANLFNTVPVADGISAMEAVQGGQWYLTGVMHMAYVGPTTDDLVGYPWRYSGSIGGCIHFSTTGLAAHGYRWFVTVLNSGIIPANLIGTTTYSASQQTTPYSMGGALSDDVLAASWPASAAIDGNSATAYSSSYFSSMGNDRMTYLAAWISGGSFDPVSEVALTARVLNGQVLGFPLLYDIYMSSGGQWVYAGQYDNQPDAGGVVRIKLPMTYSANGVLVIPRLLGVDDYNNHYFQIAEVQLAP